MSFITGNTLIDVLIAIVGLYLLILLGAPLLILSTQHFNRHFTMQIVDPKDLGLPDEVRSYFSKVFREIRTAGFRYHAVYLIPDMVPNTIAIFALFDNPQTRDLAISVSIYATNDAGQVNMQDQHVEFGCEDEQGNSFTVNNTKVVNAFAPTATRRVYSFPNTPGALDLYHLYQGVMQQENVRRKMLPPRDQYESYLRKDLIAEFASQLASGSGYLKLSADKKQFSPTVKGAFIMTWKNLFPFAQIDRWRRGVGEKSWRNRVAKKVV